MSRSQLTRAVGRLTKKVKRMGRVQGSHSARIAKNEEEMHALQKEVAAKRKEYWEEGALQNAAAGCRPDLSFSPEATYP